MENENKFSGLGSGTADDPYQITNVEQLKEMKYDENANYLLMNDLTVSQDQLHLIGNFAFTGVLNGNSFTIDIHGVFLIENKGIIQNLNISTHINDTSDGEIGGICRRNFGEIRNCSVKGTIQGSKLVGGIAGVNYYDGKIIDCNVDAEIIGSQDLGLVCGVDNGVVENTLAKGNIIVKRNTLKEKVSGFISDFNYHFSPCIWGFIYAIIILVGIDGITGWFEVIPKTAADISNWWVSLLIFPAVNIGLWIYSYFDIVSDTRIFKKNRGYIILLSLSIALFMISLPLFLINMAIISESLILYFSLCLIVLLFYNLWKLIPHNNIIIRLPKLLKLRKQHYYNNSLYTQDISKVVLSIIPLLISILFLVLINVFNLKHNSVYYQGQIFVTKEFDTVNGKKSFQFNEEFVIDTLGNILSSLTYNIGPYEIKSVAIVNNKYLSCRTNYGSEIICDSWGNRLILDSIKFYKDNYKEIMLSDSIIAMSDNSGKIKIVNLNNNKIKQFNYNDIVSIEDGFGYAYTGKPFVDENIRNVINRNGDAIFSKDLDSNIYNRINYIGNNIFECNGEYLKYNNSIQKINASQFQYIDQISFNQSVGVGLSTGINMLKYKQTKDKPLNNKFKNTKMGNVLDYIREELKIMDIQNADKVVELEKSNKKSDLVDTLSSVIIYDEQLNVIAKCDYLDATYYKDGYIAVMNYDYKWGFIGDDGKLLIENKFDVVGNFCDGFAMCGYEIQYPFMNCGFINKEGKIIVQPKYVGLTEFSDGLAFYKKNNKWGIIDTKGNEITKPLFKEVNEGFKHGIARVDGYLIKRDGTKLEPKKNFLWRLLHE